MLWCSVVLIGLLMLPLLVARAHVIFSVKCLDSFILRYRYFAFFNLILMALYCLFKMYSQLDVISLWVNPAPSFVIYGLTVLLVTLVSFCVYALLQDRLLCVTPALLGTVFAVLAALFFVFQLSYHLAWRNTASIIDLVYALTVAVLCFRYSCMVTNHYEAVAS